MGKNLKTSLLPTLRLIIMVVLVLCLLYFAYTGISGVVKMTSVGITNVWDVGGIIFLLLMTILLMGIPAIMLHSLLTKKLVGFAACVGAIAALSLFYGLIVLPPKLGIMQILSSNTFVPDPIKILIGLPLSIILLILPFWVLFRTIRLTNEWIYPKLFKPLETKI